MADGSSDLFGGMPPLDLGELGAPQTPAAPAMTARQQMKDIGPLLAILPIAMAKGGRAGVAALLQGFQQARQQRQGDAQKQQQTQSLDAYRQATLKQTAANNEAIRRQQLMQSFQSGLNQIETPEALQAYLTLYESQAQAIGLRPDTFRSMANAVMSPTRLQRKEAEEIRDKAKVKFGEQAAAHTYTTRDGTPLTWAELNQRAGVTLGAPTTEAVDLSKSGLDVQAAAALKRGDTAEYDRLKKVADEMSGARRAEQNPVLAEIQRLRLEQAKDAAANKPALPPRTQQAVNALARGWDSLPIVKTVQKQAEAVAFADALDPNTKNPADDQALIYAFAKAMDPDSVVREGEYATVQKYAQSWAESFGFNAARIFSNTAFLTPQARQNMKKTIRARYLAGKGQYDNVRRSYAAKVNKLTGLQDGQDYLTDYAGGFPEDQTSVRAKTPSANPFRPSNAAR